MKKTNNFEELANTAKKAVDSEEYLGLWVSQKQIKRLLRHALRHGYSGIYPIHEGGDYLYAQVFKNKNGNGYVLYLMVEYNEPNWINPWTGYSEGRFRYETLMVAEISTEVTGRSFRKTAKRKARNR